MAKTIALEIRRGEQHLPYLKQQSERQRHVEKCTAMYDRDGDIKNFLLSLNHSSKNTEFGNIPEPEQDLVLALEGECNSRASFSGRSKAIGIHKLRLRLIGDQHRSF